MPLSMNEQVAFMSTEIERRVAIEVDRRFAAWRAHTTAYLDGQLKSLAGALARDYVDATLKMRADLDQRFDQKLSEVETAMLRQFRAQVQDIKRQTTIEVAIARRKPNSGAAHHP
ncbi:hypothetical protein OOJ09_31475 [Mesorhizobium qingshengii]|uniref:Phasin protein n=1 Tax=Mesorhizobium qingshengii TaxID=1165689 RepID=A0ABT4R566_9HYPH|nr:hypothetical protein [Mesorhizobium qingshengii]MCZ8548698.1 hypothetical protein [Mesorhizobium qingshengii]